MSRVNELLQREIASSLYRLNLEDRLDLSRVTVTHVITSPDLRKSRVLVSYLGDLEEAKIAIRLLNRKRKDLQSMISKVVVLKYTPHLFFALDQSISQGARVLEIMEHLPPPEEEEQETLEEYDDGPEG